MHLNIVSKFDPYINIFMTINLNQSSIAIIIGCWEQHNNNKAISCYNNIINYINQNDHIHTVILSGNHCKIDQNNQGPNHWFRNSAEIFDYTQGVDWIRRYWNNYNNEKFFAEPSKIIKDFSWNKNCLMAFEQWQLEYLLNHIFVDTANIWYFGIGWKYGVMRDPIGWGSLSDLIKNNHVKKRNILTKEDCILADKSLDLPNLNLFDWKKIEDTQLIYFKDSYYWEII